MDFQSESSMFLAPVLLHEAPFAGIMQSLFTKKEVITIVTLNVENIWKAW